MDLTHDWKTFNDVMFPRDISSSGRSRVVLVENNGIVVDGVVSTGVAFQDVGIEISTSNKEKLDAIAAKYNVDQTLVLPKKDLDQQIIEAAGLGTNYFQQLESLRVRFFSEGSKTPTSKSKGLLVVSRRHFLLNFFQSKFRFFYPRRFNVLIFVDTKHQFTRPGQPSYQAVLLSYTDGELDQFFEPDFSSLHDTRLSDWALEAKSIGQYLENRYMLKCYSLFMHKEDWERCLRLDLASQNSKNKLAPWAHLVHCYLDGRAMIYPVGLFSRILFGFVKFLSLFSRNVVA